MDTTGPRKGSRLSLNGSWIVGNRIGSGGFGRVHEVEAEEERAAAKFMPKAPGAERELLFVNLEGVRNVVPIIDSGETKRHWVLIMPRGDKSLREHLEQIQDQAADVEDVTAILKDIAAALADLEGKVVHRDLKPENVLLLEGKWCLADFGISRYAEATTAPDTQKFALSPPYAAPERWRNERATAATDVYSFGVMAYEMLAGSLPFAGPGTEDYREQHLHADPPRLEGTPSLLSALIDECLYKAPDARPRPANVEQRLDRINDVAPSGGLARLQAANQDEVSRRSEQARQKSQARSLEEQRWELFESGANAFTRIGDALREAILAAAPSVSQEQPAPGGWVLRLHEASLSLAPPHRAAANPWQWETPPLNVVAYSTLSLRIPRRDQYEGRSHSLWFCDAEQQEDFGWYETAFMVSALIAQRGRQDPFALDPGEAASKALSNAMTDYQLAWPFTRLVIGEIDEFVDRWGGWFADAAGGRLRHPSHMPERETARSWRR